MLWHLSNWYILISIFLFLIYRTCFAVLSDESIGKCNVINYLKKKKTKRNYIFCVCVCIANRFTPDNLVEMVPNVGCIVDLTATSRYYNPQVYIFFAPFLSFSLLPTVIVLCIFAFLFSFSSTCIYSVSRCLWFRFSSNAGSTTRRSFAQDTSSRNQRQWEGKSTHKV